jgi:hypothetical protein
MAFFEQSSYGSEIVERFEYKNRAQMRVSIQELSG